MKGTERLSFERHLHACQPCRQQYDAEAAVKAAVRRHIPRVKAPQSLRDAISRQIHTEEQEAQGRESLFQRVRAFTAQPVIRLLGLVLAASVAIFVLVLMLQQGVQEEDRNLLAYSRLTHRALEAGDLAPGLVSGDADRVQGYLTKETNLSVMVPLLADYTLVGGLADTYDDLRTAHLVYRQDGTLLSIAEISLDDVLHGKGLTLPLNVRNELLHSGWYAGDQNGGEAVMLWTHGTTLCVAVARMSTAALKSTLKRLEGTTPADMPW